MAYAIGEAVPWPVPPDWGTAVRDTRAWLTDYINPRNGARQKRQLRLSPRRTVEFNVVATDANRRLVDALRFDQGARQWLLPIWPDLQYLSASLSLGSTSIPCATTGYDFADAGQALLWSAPNHWEVVQVATVESDHLALSAATLAIWPAGTRLYPLRLARVPDAAQESLWTDDASQIKVVMQVDEPCDWPAVAPATTYRGYPVLEWRGEESSGPNTKYDRAIQTVDGTTGAIVYIDLPAQPFRTQSHNWQLVYRAEYAAFLSLLYWLRGRMGTLWMPSFASDLLLAASVASDAISVSVEWAGYTVFGRQQSNRRDIRIELYSGAVLYRRITASIEAGNTETLTLDSALGVAVAPADVRCISFMTLSEQAADSISIDHVTDADGLAQAQTTWAGIRHDV